MRERFDLIRNAYQGETAFLFSCGPSFDPDQLAKHFPNLKNSLVIAVKQAYDELSEIADFHILNTINHKKYKYSKNTIRILGRPFNEETPIVGPAPHLECRAERQLNMLSGDAAKQLWLVRTLNFEKYKFNRQIERPWGPSIIVEICLYMLLHMGVKRVVCVGWDVTPPRKSNMEMPHYYERKTSSILTLPDKLASLLLESLPKKVPARYKKLIEMHIKYHLGKTYNVCQVDPTENEAIWNASGDLYKYFQAEGMEIALASDISHLSSEIPRTKLAVELT